MNAATLDGADAGVEPQRVEEGGLRAIHARLWTATGGRVSFRDRDFLKRMIEQLSQLVTSIAGKRRQVPPEVLVDQLRREKEDLLGVPLVVLDSLPPAAVRDAVGGDQALAAYREVLALEAELLDEAGRPDQAAAVRQRLQSLA